VSAPYDGSLAVEGVTFTYPTGVTALRDVSLSFAPGEAVAIIGENGAGKTTLARHLNGLLRPTQGRVLVGDWDTRQRTVAQIAARVGYAFQNPDDQLFERTARAEVAFGPKNLGFTPQAVEDAVRSALALVGLEAAADKHPYDLPLSQRRLLALAATLAMQTPAVILDEPTTGQDAPSIERIGRIVEDLKAQGRTVIAITHDIDFCAEHFARVIVMAGGVVLADGPAAVVLSRADVLAQAEVEPPQLLRLAAALGMDSAPLTVEAFVSDLATRSPNSQGGDPR